MALELAQLVAEFPLAASFAIAGGITALREGRRRTSLNQALHELRRPLQVLALSLPAEAATVRGVDSSLRLVAAAVDQLEREINGDEGLNAPAPIDLDSLVDSAVERWRPHARRANRTLRLQGEIGESLLRGSETELSQAVDNMINNAFDHGGGEVIVEVRRGAGFLRLAVLDGGRSAPSSKQTRTSFRGRISGRARHGHGLKVVRRVAARHGGSFHLRHSSRGAEARLDLPVLGGGG